MKKLALAIVLTALGSTAASASEWAFDDNYWKKPDVATSFQQSAAPSTGEDSFAKYHHVDGYNP
jgi:hypothetical protein